MNNNKEIGNKAEDMVKRQLWRNGYSVKDVSNFTNYDLLVDNKTKVEVKSASHRHTKEGIYWLLQHIIIKPNSADVLAIVISTPLDEALIFYMKITNRTFEQLEEYKMIVHDKLQRNGDVVCNIKLDTKALKVLFTDSPSKIFTK